MRSTTKGRSGAWMPAVLAALLLAGCGLGGGDDKAGGSNAPTTLRLAAADDAEQPDARLVRYFAARVAELSGGSVRVQVTWDAGGESADHEARIATRVRDGDFDLGWIGARAWDQLGIKSFQALQAPFLVTDHELLSHIATGPLGAEMLSGLDGQGLVGLALVQDRLRYPFGARHAFTSPEDFRGARLKVLPSRATETVIRALGAEPVQIDGDKLSAAVAAGEIDGAEASLGTNNPDEGETFVAGNVVLFAKALTLFAGEDAFDELGEDERSAIREAARQTARYAAGHHPSESRMLREFCDSGRAVEAVRASRAELAALRQAAQPAYRELGRDPRTRSLIAEIESLKRSSAPAAAPLPTCERPVVADGGEGIDPSTLDGTYHWRVTSEGAVAAGGSANDEDVGTVGKMTLRDGRWRMGDEDPEEYSGTYEIRGDGLVFDWGGTLLAFRFERDAERGLRLTPIQPMDLGDAVVWAGGPWRRVGPPVRDIP